MRWVAALASAVALLAAGAVHAQSPRSLDAFETLSPWTADASTDVSSAISSVEGYDGRAMRLTYDFNGRSGYAFAARALDLDVTENYEISFWLRGEMRPNTLEVKFVDASGDNVHWRQIRGFQATPDWTRYTIKKRQIVRAWGPNPDPVFRGAERMEFVVTAGEGGSGWIEIDRLEIRDLPPDPSVPPRPLASATSEEGLNVAARAVDDDPATAWRSAAAGEQSLTLDLGYEREFGGVTLRWAEGLAASGYRLRVSSDRREWRLLATVENGDGGVDWLRTPEASGRWLSLDLRVPASGTGDAPSPAAYALNALEIEPLSFGDSPTAFMRAVAEESRRGLYPRGFHGEQPYWTLVGVDGGGESALMGEDGAIELRRGGPSIEPFVIENGRLVTWADVNVTQGLMAGSDHLPMPTVTWTTEDWSLRIETFADGPADNPRLFGRYYLTNLTAAPRTLTLALMARSFQVNGPVQFLSTPGGVGPIRQVDWTGGELVLNDAVRILPLTPPDAVAASTFAAGGDPQALLADAARRRSPVERLVESDDGLASGALIYDIALQPGQTRQAAWVTAMSGALAPLPDEGTVEATLDAVQAALADEWRGKLDRFDLTLPPQAGPVEAVMKSSLAHMLMSRRGPILQPGTRSYNRSWIRDGAMMAEGLNRLGHQNVSADYLRWFAPLVFDNGKVPCCADSRGADPVPENDSHGEFVFLAAETFRYGHDVTLLREVWPRVQAAIAYMDTLRASTRTAAFETADRRHLYGLLPPTISHEGYSDRPAYSYWDDFWGLRGYRDAIYIAGALGDAEAAARFAASEAEFRADIMASIAATAQVHGIGWIAGAADRGDFDATSTTIALSPGGLQDELPPALLQQTFDKWWENFTARQDNRRPWRDYTPYELRNVGALVRLGRREDALRALDFYFSDMRPRAWNGWAEVVGRDEREPRFIGDMPHAWISSDYIRSALDLLVYERDRDQALVLAAGIPTDWLEGEGVGVADVRTAYGPLTYRFVRENDGAGPWVLTLEAGARPPGGFVIQWPPGETPPARVTIDGRPAVWSGRELAIPVGAQRVEMD